MIYSDEGEYRVKFYQDTRTGEIPVLVYLQELPGKERAKVLKYIDFLRQHQGILDEPYSRHLAGKIRELRVDFARHRHRILYFTLVGRVIILLHVFLKKTPKTPTSEMKAAEERYFQVVSNKHLYE